MSSAPASPAREPGMVTADNITTNTPTMTLFQTVAGVAGQTNMVLSINHSSTTALAQRGRGERTDREGHDEHTHQPTVREAGIRVGPNERGQEDPSSESDVHITRPAGCQIREARLVRGGDGPAGTGYSEHGSLGVTGVSCGSGRAAHAQSYWRKERHDRRCAPTAACFTARPRSIHRSAGVSPVVPGRFDRRRGSVGRRRHRLSPRHGYCDADRV